MPGNIVVVNDWAKFYVGDSKMPELMVYLEDNGVGENKVAKKLIKDRKEALSLDGEEGIPTTRHKLSRHVSQVHPEITMPRGKLR